MLSSGYLSESIYSIVQYQFLPDFRLCWFAWREEYKFTTIMEIRNDRLICGSQRPFKIKFDVFFYFYIAKWKFLFFWAKINLSSSWWQKLLFRFIFCNFLLEPQNYTKGGIGKISNINNAFQPRCLVKL